MIDVYRDLCTESIQAVILDLFFVIDRPVFHPQLSFDRILKS